MNMNKTILHSGIVLLTLAAGDGCLRRRHRYCGSPLAQPPARSKIAWSASSTTWPTGSTGPSTRSGTARLSPDARSSVAGYASSASGVRHTAAVEPLADALGMGRSLLITSTVPDGPKLLLRISLYDEQGFIALAAGLENTTDKVIQLKEITPLEGEAFAGFDTQSRYSTLDGFSGGAKTYVSHEGRKRKSLNNLLATFGNPGENRSLVLGGLSYEEFEKNAEVERGPSSLAIRLSAADPVGKRVDPGTRYLVAKDRFYVDFLTDNPFDALESYANNVRLAQPVVLPVCRFPIVDTWFAQVPHFGGGEDRARLSGAERFRRRGRGDGVRGQERVPEILARRRSCSSRTSTTRTTSKAGGTTSIGSAARATAPSDAGTWVSSHGQFVPPYETARKWAGAVKALGGIPMIYIQTGFRSQDYAEKFPGHMLFNEPNAPHVNEKGEQLYRDKEKKQPRKLGYDYTDPGFHPPRPRSLGEPPPGRHSGREVRLSRLAVHRLADARRHGRQLCDHGHALPQCLPARQGGPGARLLPARAGPGPRLRRHAGAGHFATHGGRHRPDRSGDGLARRPALVQEPRRAQLRHGRQEPVPRRSRQPRRRSGRC